MGKPARSRRSQSYTPRFSRHELREMEKLIHEGKDDILDEMFHQKLADEFNLAPSRAGSRAIQTKQVRNWFLARHNGGAVVHAAPVSKELVLVQPQPAYLPVVSKELVVLDGPILQNALVSSSVGSRDIGEKIPNRMNFEFEAQSKGGGWYDVAMFIRHRCRSGELEALVRYQGFSADEDEWVNVKNALRLRSIPLESSECRRVAVGDMVICFRETKHEACHFDAHVVDIQRKLHDIRGCRCIFSIVYDHDKTKERVPLRRLCRRP